MSYRLMKGLNTHDKQRHVECQKGRIVHVELALRVNSSLSYAWFVHFWQFTDISCLLKDYEDI